MTSTSGSEAPPKLAAGLRRVISVTAGASDPWWLIGSAAMALLGAEVSVADVDLLMSAADAERVRTGLSLANLADSGSELFRSEVFLRLETEGLPVEVMGGFEHRSTEGWRRVWPRSRQAISWEGGVVFVPELAELTTITQAFGRPKDLARVEALGRLAL